jgi:hypothetical protein
MKTYWLSDVAKTCELGCGRSLHEEFVDGRTKYGPWALMCIECWRATGFKLGLGSGQRYKRQPSGLYIKVEG